MSQPPAPDPSLPQPSPAEEDRREPEGSPQRQLVETVQAFEVDPPPPARVQDAGDGGPDEGAEDRSGA